MEQLTISDLYAIKSEAWQKMKYFEVLKGRDAKYLPDYEAWKSRHIVFDHELMRRIQELPTA